MSEAGKAESARARGRKATRLRRTILTLVAILLAGGAVAVGWYVTSRPDTYRPGEQHAEIKRSLSRELPAGAPTPELTDVTAEAGLGDFVHFVGTRSSQLPEDMGSGAAWGDYDGDGDDDLFLVASGGSLELSDEQRAPSVLYENLGDGSFRRAAGFPEPRIIGMGAAWGDYDGDGRQDLVVTGYRALLLFHNDGDSFTRDERVGASDGYWAGAGWGDYDRDGDLDLYVCGYVQYFESAADRARATVQYGRSVPYTLNPASYRPERNLLFRNDGPAGFTEVAAELGVDNLQGRSLGALWHDLDDDGWLDLYVANDISDNAFYRNTGSGFEDLSHAAWVADYRGAMGLAAGDWNRDGDDDLFVSHWVAQENALYDSQLAGNDEAADAATPVRFVDVADQRGLGQIALRQVGWGAEFADLDGDGWLDLPVVNGSTFATGDTPPRLVAQPSFLFWNAAGKHFHDLAPLSQALATPRVTRGLALSDYDRDGDLDLLLVHHGEGVQLLRNDMQSGNWLQLRLRQRQAGGGAGFGDGARVVARVGETTLRRTVSSASYLSQSSRTLHLGLGQASGVDSLDVRWPDGGEASYGRLEAGATWELTQGETEATRIGPSPAAAPPVADSGNLTTEEKQRIVEFWSHQRAAMKAMKVHDDLPRAIDGFRKALALNPDHGDSIYYLASCLAAQGKTAAAIEQLETLVRLDPMSHRGFRQLGLLRAMSATTADELGPAEAALERALEINREETGALLILGEIALLQGDGADAERRLGWACSTNPRAVSGFFLRGYVAWSAGRADDAADLLRQARQALGDEWKPAGMTAEGDVTRKQHDDTTPLSRFWKTWDGEPDPDAAFAALHAHLSSRGGG